MCTVLLGSTEGLDSLKVDKDRLGQLRELGWHESRHIKPQVVSFVYPVSNAQLCCFRCGNRLYQLRGLGRQSTRQASSGSLRLPCCALRGRVDFRQTAGFGVRHWPSFLIDVVFLHEPGAGTNWFVDILDGNCGLQIRCPFFLELLDERMSRFVRRAMWMFVSSSVSIELFAAACGRYWRGAPRAECIVDSVPVGKQHRALFVQIEQKSLEVPQSQFPEQVLDVLAVTQQPQLHFFNVYRCPIGTSELTPGWCERDLGSDVVFWFVLGHVHDHTLFQLRFADTEHIDTQAVVSLSRSSGLISNTFLCGVDSLPSNGKSLRYHHHPFFQEVSLWFEEDPVSEVVFRFDVGHHHLHLPVRLRRH